MDEYHQLVHYLKNDDKIDNQAKEFYEKICIKQETHQPCFAKIVFKQIKHKLLVFVQFTIVGVPTAKGIVYKIYYRYCRIIIRNYNNIIIY